MKTTIGGDRLGSGNKQEVSMKNYSRSSHDLSYTWRSSMAAGTLVPFMKRLALPGDTWDINLNAECLTLPTLGPLFGSFKLQADVFQVPIRLYNHRLHMNELGIGMDMSKVKLPQMEMAAKWTTEYSTLENLANNVQVNPSSLYKYLGISGIGRWTGTGNTITRNYNAVPLLGYWDIFKNYYANKQEENAWGIHMDATNRGIPVTGAELGLNVSGSTVWIPIFGTGSSKSFDNSQVVGLRVMFAYEEQPDASGVLVNKNLSSVAADSLFSDNVWDPNLKQYTFTNPSGLSGTENWYVPTQNVDPLSPVSMEAVRLVSFPLSVIDDCRKAILRHPNDDTAFELTTDFPNPPYNWFRNTSGGTPSLYACTFPQESLAIKTYQSDLFNNWISTEWIDGPNGVNEVTKVDTTGDSFTIDALNLAQKVYVMLNRIAISGGTYDDWLDAVYTHERRRGIENPVYLGSLIKELAFQQVVSNAKTEDTDETKPLGTLAGRGTLTNKNKGGKIIARIDEPSYLLGIVSLTPRIDYSQGNDWDVNLKSLDDLHKPALDAIGFQDLLTDQMAWQDTELNVADTPIYKSAGKQPAWINYMTEVNKCYGNFAFENKEMYMTLNRRYTINETGIADLTTYIDPTKFNFIFAQQDISSQNFWMQIAVNITSRRKMSAKVIPNL